MFKLTYPWGMVRFIYKNYLDENLCEIERFGVKVERVC